MITKALAAPQSHHEIRARARIQTSLTEGPVGGQRHGQGRRQAVISVGVAGAGELGGLQARPAPVGYVGCR